MIEQTLSDIRKRLKQEKADSFLITNDTDVLYLSRFPCTYGRILITGKRCFFITDLRYKLDAEKSEWLKKHFQLMIQEKGLEQLLISLAASIKIKSCLLDSGNVTLRTFWKFQKEANSIHFIPTKTPVHLGRLTKSDYEKKLIVKSLRIAEKSFLDTLPLIKPGISEHEIRTELEYRFMRNGADSTSFESIIASGKNAATPHAHATNKKIRSGDMIIMDFGVKKDGYCSDTTRTVFIGKPDSLYVKRYEAVREAMLMAQNQAKPGIASKSVDSFARESLKRNNLDKYFTHSLGHGCGLDVHEDPFVNPRSESILKKGMVITIEPGIYIKGWGGIRIENMVHVTSGNPEILTKLSSKMLVI